MKRKTREEFADYIEKTTNGEYRLIGDYINNKTKAEIKHERCGKTFMMRPAKFTEGHRCPYCSRMKHKDIDEMRRVIQAKYPNMYLYGEYTASTKPALFYHMDCGRMFHATPTDILRGKKCPFCSNKITGQSESFQNKLNEQFFGEILLLEAYKGMNKKTKFCCTKTSTRFSAKPKDLLLYQRCPVCEDMQPKNDIGRFLDVAEIEYRRDEMFISGCIMKFDYFIPSMNLAIDYNGHFYYNDMRYIQNDMNDRSKRSIESRYCKENKIKLLRIPFWEKAEINEILYDLFMNVDEKTSYTEFNRWKGKLHFGGYKSHR